MDAAAQDDRIERATRRIAGVFGNLGLPARIVGLTGTPSWLLFEVAAPSATRADDWRIHAYFARMPGARVAAARRDRYEIAVWEDSYD